MTDSDSVHEGSSPSLPAKVSMCPGDGIGIRARLRSVILRVRLPSWAPSFISFGHWRRSSALALGARGRDGGILMPDQVSSTVRLRGAQPSGVN